MEEKKFTIDCWAFFGKVDWSIESSEDKKINLEYPLFDSEVPVTPSYIRHLLDDYFDKNI